MRLGMNLPVMVPGLDRQAILGWCRAIDEGPWDTLALGERINFPNPEAITTLAAAAAVTERVELLYNVAVVPMHDPVLLAKQLATIDVISGGRLTVGVGIGGRAEDYRAVGAKWNGPKLARLADGVARMRAVWGGEVVGEALRPVEPFPLQDGGPPILAGALGPKSIERAAQWADGLLGFDFSFEAGAVGGAFDRFRQSWSDAGRPGAPRLASGTWFALGDDAHAGDGSAQMQAYLKRYLNFLEPATDDLIPLANITDGDALVAAAQRARDLGADDFVLTPTTASIEELQLAADILR
jgi:alkanesulfonate monooxygenase SsuD/methylene tetrahydromethanopterin reductase-like flavin-dependent oxidoreductase (luciferase family)